MNYLKQSRTVMIDIDDTILLWNPEEYPHVESDLITIEEDGHQFKFLAHKKHIEFIRKLKLQGYGIVFWSAGGNEWAQRIVNKLGIQELADVIMSKPEFALDDLLDATKIIKSVVWIDPTTGKYKRNE